MHEDYNKQTQVRACFKRLVKYKEKYLDLKLIEARPSIPPSMSYLTRTKAFMDLNMGD